MFDMVASGDDTAPWDLPGSSTTRVRYDDLDTAEDELVALEARVAGLRARQVKILAWLDRVKVTRVQGTRTMNEWVISRPDVTRPPRGT